MDHWIYGCESLAIATSLRSELHFVMIRLAKQKFRSYQTVLLMQQHIGSAVLRVRTRL